MLFIRGYFLFLNLCLLIDGQSDAEDSNKVAFADVAADFTTLKPELHNSCQANRLKSSDVYIICPTMVKCVTKFYAWHFHSSFIHVQNSIQTCESVKGDNRLSVFKVGQLKAVHRLLTWVNETIVCHHEFRSIETFQGSLMTGIDFGQLVNRNCHIDNATNCGYQLKTLALLVVKIESLSNNSFCQFRQLEVLTITGCSLSSIEANAFVHLVNLKWLFLPFNRLTHLHVDLFRHNVNLQMIFLKNNRLQLPTLKAFHKLGSLKLLYLSGNYVNLLNDSSTFPKNLGVLFLEDNDIHTIGLGLSNLDNLTEIKLSGNGATEVKEDAFLNLKSLKVIDLGQNKIENLDKNTFENNLQLEKIDLRGNRLGDFPPIGHLRNLTVVLLALNRIRSINNDDLINCSRLSHLDVSRNQLSFIEVGALDNLRQLETLNLSHNRLSEKNFNFKHSFASFQLDLDYNSFSSFSFRDFPPSANQLSLRFNRIETIETFDFHEERRQWNLTSLNLFNNFLVSIESLRLPPSVRSLNFSSNRISQLMPFGDCTKEPCAKLHWVDLRNNNLSVLCESVFGGPETSNIKINYYVSRNPLKCTCELSWVTFPRKIPNDVRFVDLMDIDCLSPPLNTNQPSYYPQQLIALRQDDFMCISKGNTGNRCDCPQQPAIQCEVQSCPYNCTCLSDIPFKFVHFLCDNRQFRHIPTQFLYNDFPNSIVELDFSQNSIYHLGPFDFGHLKSKIFVLKLHASDIESIDEDAFEGLTQLATLNLGYNRLRSLPKGLFRHFTQLLFLSLSNNRLIHLADDTFDSLNSLIYLNLNDNSLKQLELERIVELKSLYGVTLHNNPWSCECTFIKPFKDLLMNSSTPIRNRLELNCTEEESGQLLNIINFNTDHCNTRIHLTIIIVSLTFGLVLIVTAAMVFVWRYELQVLVYARYGLRMFHQAEEEVENKQYDAFVAYNSEDEEFLFYHLLPKLEEIENPYHLCIHSRNFPAGAVIQDNILEAIRVSSRTIILLSENFVSSGWCRFEFKSAHMKMMEDKCPRILVILLGEVPKTLEPEMKLYLKTNTYLKWGEKLFWEKFYYAMPDKRVILPPTDATSCL